MNETTALVLMMREQIMALKLLRPQKEAKKVSAAAQSQRANRTILRRTLFLMILCGIVLFIPLINSFDFKLHCFLISCFSSTIILSIS